MVLLSAAVGIWAKNGMQGTDKPVAQAEPWLVLYHVNNICVSKMPPHPEKWELPKETKMKREEAVAGSVLAMGTASWDFEYSCMGLSEGSPTSSGQVMVYQSFPRPVERDVRTGIQSDERCFPNNK